MRIPSWFSAVAALALAAGAIHCASGSSSTPAMSLTYESLWNEAFEETVIITSDDVYWFQHRDPRTEVALSRREEREIRKQIGALCAWARRAGADQMANGEFVVVRCDQDTPVRVSLIKATEDEWAALEQIDAVLEPLLDDYYPIAGSARRNLGY